jgi:hypothetical protein
MHSYSEAVNQYREWETTVLRGRERVKGWLENPAAHQDIFPDPSPSIRSPGLLTPSTSRPAKIPDFLARPSHPDDRKGSDASQGVGSRYETRSVTRQRHSFVGLPAEIRNMVYQLCVDYPNCRTLFDSFYSQQAKHSDGKGRKGKGNHMLLVFALPLPPFSSCANRSLEKRLVSYAIESLS